MTVTWQGAGDYEPTEAMVSAGEETNHRNNSTDNMIASFKAMMMQAEIDGLVRFSSEPVKAASPEGAAVAVPGGWRLVPGKPPRLIYRSMVPSTPPASERAEVVAITDDMVDRAVEAWHETTGLLDDVLRAVLSAALDGRAPTQQADVVASPEMKDTER